MKTTLCLALGAALFATGANAENTTIRHVIDGYVIPAYADFNEAVRDTREAMEQLCADPSYGGAERARQGFKALVETWSAAEPIRFGPITEDNRLERILFWPDRKGIGLRQVQAAIANEDPTANDPLQLAQKSVAMQGLGALEFVLYGTGFEALETGEGHHRCEYGRAIVTNINQMMDAVQTGWLDPKGIATDWANPAAGNALYRTDDEALTEVLNVLVHGVELIRDVRLDGFLGATPEDDKPKQAIYWRSGNTTNALAANLRGLNKLADAADFASMLPADSRWIPQSADFEFGNAERALAKLDAPVADMLADPEKRQTLGYVRLVTSSLSDILAVKLVAALGLTAGFSSLDGD
ncbi:MAG: imelysin family protein [Rhizobiaceae bacterium]